MTTPEPTGLPLAIPGLAITDRAAFEAWLSTDDHVAYCLGYWESQTCCLEYLLGFRDARDDRPSGALTPGGASG